MTGQINFAYTHPSFGQRINRMLKIRLQKRFSWFAGGLAAVFSFLIFSNVSCTAQPAQSIALRSLREMSKKGQLPAESVVANLEARYPGSNVAALARLMRARIRMTNGNSAGAARLLDSPMFEQKTKVTRRFHVISVSPKN